MHFQFSTRGISLLAAPRGIEVGGELDGVRRLRAANGGHIAEDFIRMDLRHLSGVYSQNSNRLTFRLHAPLLNNEPNHVRELSATIS